VQFPPVHFAGQTFLPSQANNLYIFPAVGMAIYATNAKRVTDAMFIEAAHAVADQVTPDQLKLGMLFPPQSNLLEVEVQTAARVAKLVFDAGLARADRPADIEAFIRGSFTNRSTKHSGETTGATRWAPHARKFDALSPSAPAKWEGEGRQATGVWRFSWWSANRWGV
jgi:hypothetical protein